MTGSNPLRAFAWAMGAVIAFCMIAVATRELDRRIPVQEIIVFRAAIGLVITALIISVLKRYDMFRTTRPGLHLIRSGFHFFGQAGWLYGIGFLTLADVFALEFTVPVWVALIAAVFLREHLTPRKIVSIALGLAGVVIIVNPGSGVLDPVAMIVAGAAICYAITHTANKSLTNTETSLGIVFYMSLVQLPIGLVLSYNSWVSPGGIEWLFLAVIGLSALIGHYCLTQAMQIAEVGYVMTIDFLRLPLISAIGVWLYLEPFKLSLLLGGLVIVAGNLVNLQDQMQRVRKASM